ncbi:hypothetical protein PVK06_047388 [Gossypium arboreum]|uniref:Uncharacterized protein n=1 Tax=Gossypium arboreum TaxID=29729 RepID=A0ABR0MDA2_GOSAR|nr:hypothetical protein PVK06_047388 [Gossypium arboreum]
MKYRAKVRTVNEKGKKEVNGEENKGSNRSMREAEREEDGEESMGKDGLVAHDGGEAIGEAYIGAVVRVMVLEKKMAMRAMSWLQLTLQR